MQQSPSSSVSPGVPISLRVASRRVTLRCAVCHDDGDVALVPCAACGTQVHAECRGGRCPTLGCVVAVRAAGRGPWWLVRKVAAALGWLSVAATLAFGALLAYASIVCGHPGATREARARAQVRAIECGAEIFRAERRRWPVNLDELRGCSSVPHVEALDPWGTRYWLREVRGRIVVTSFGPDRLPGGGDDLRSRDDL